MQILEKQLKIRIGFFKMKKCLQCNNKLKGKRTLFCGDICWKIYRYKQKIIPCEICGFNKTTERHHIISRKKFGSEDKENIVFLCPNHHRMIHNSIYSKSINNLIFKKTNKKGKKINKDKIKEIKKKREIKKNFDSTKSLQNFREKMGGIK